MKVTATATALWHRGAAGETKSLAKGPGSQKMHPHRDGSLVMQFLEHSVLLHTWWPCTVPFLSCRCPELAYSSRDSEASPEQAALSGDICTGSTWASSGLESI